jgi:hypothetical protein
MWAVGLASKLSSAVTRTLACSDSGQPPPNRFDPQTEQNVFSVPSSGWYVRSRSSPSRTLIESVRARALTVPAPPEIFLQFAQCQYVTRSNGSVTSNCTPPQRHRPVTLATAR